MSGIARQARSAPAAPPASEGHALSHQLSDQPPAACADCRSGSPNSRCLDQERISSRFARRGAGDEQPEAHGAQQRCELLPVQRREMVAHRADMGSEGPPIPGWLTAMETPPSPATPRPRSRARADAQCSGGL